MEKHWDKINKFLGKYQLRSWEPNRLGGDYAIGAIIDRLKEPDYFNAVKKLIDDYPGRKKYFTSVGGHGEKSNLRKVLEQAHSPEMVLAANKLIQEFPDRSDVDSFVQFYLHKLMQNTQSVKKMLAINEIITAIPKPYTGSFVYRAESILAQKEWDIAEAESIGKQIKKMISKFPNKRDKDEFREVLESTIPYIIKYARGLEDFKAANRSIDLHSKKVGKSDYILSVLPRIMDRAKSTEEIEEYAKTANKLAEERPVAFTRKQYAKYVFPRSIGIAKSSKEFREIVKTVNKIAESQGGEKSWKRENFIYNFITGEDERGGKRYNVISSCDDLKEIQAMQRIIANYPKHAYLDKFLEDTVPIMREMKVNIGFIERVVKNEREIQFVKNICDLMKYKKDYVEEIAAKGVKRKTDKNTLWSALWEELKANKQWEDIGGVGVPKAAQLKQSKEADDPAKRIARSRKRTEALHKEIKKTFRKEFGKVAQELTPQLISSYTHFKKIDESRSYREKRGYGADTTHGLIAAYLKGGNAEAEEYISGLDANKEAARPLKVPAFKETLQSKGGVNWEAYNAHTKELVENVNAFVKHYDEEKKEGKKFVKKKAAQEAIKENVEVARRIVKNGVGKNSDLEEVKKPLSELKRFVQNKDLKEAINRVDSLMALKTNVGTGDIEVRLHGLKGLDRLFLGMDRKLATLGSCLRVIDGEFMEKTIHNATNNSMPVLTLENKEGQRSRVQLAYADDDTITHVHMLGKYSTIHHETGRTWIRALIATAARNKKNLFLHDLTREQETALKKVGFEKKEMDVPKGSNCYQDITGYHHGMYAPYEKLKKLRRRKILK